jgi:hypothetical protein
MNRRTTCLSLAAIILIGFVSGQTKKRTRLQQDDGYELTRQPEDLMFCVLGPILENFSDLFSSSKFGLFFPAKNNQFIFIRILRTILRI